MLAPSPVARAHRAARSAVPAAFGVVALVALAACDTDAPTAAPPAPSAASAAARAPGDSGAALAASAPPARGVFVDPAAGDDAAAGTAAKPFRTLAKALALAVAGDTVRLAPGGYAGLLNGEQFTDATHTVTVRAGVTVLGAVDAEGRPASLLFGAGQDVGLRLEGAAKVRNVSLTGFGVGILARKGVQSLINVAVATGPFRGGAPVPVNGTVFTLAGGIVALGTANAFLSNGQLRLDDLVNGARLFQQAHFTMTGGAITTSAPNCRTGVPGIRADQSAQVKMTDVVVTNVAGPVVHLTQQSKATLTGGLIQRHLQPGCTPDPVAFIEGSGALTTDHVEIIQLTLGGAFATLGVGIETLSDGPLTLQTTSVGGFGTGIKVDAGNGPLSVTQSSFSGCLTCLDARAAGAKVTVAKTFVQSGVPNSVGIVTPTTAAFALRGSDVSSNFTGILVTGPNADLGTATDPGNNTITNNLVTGVKVEDLVPRVDVRARGNTWAANTQQADAAGHYPAGLLFNGLNANATGKNFDLRQFNSKATIRILF